MQVFPFVVDENFPRVKRFYLGETKPELLRVWNPVGEPYIQLSSDMFTYFTKEVTQDDPEGYYLFFGRDAITGDESPRPPVKGTWALEIFEEGDPLPVDTSYYFHNDMV